MLMMVLGVLKPLLYHHSYTIPNVPPLIYMFFSKWKMMKYFDYLTDAKVTIWMIWDEYKFHNSNQTITLFLEQSPTGAPALLSCCKARQKFFSELYISHEVNKEF